MNDVETDTAPDAELTFEFSMHPGMDGPHDMAFHVPVTRSSTPTPPPTPSTSPSPSPATPATSATNPRFEGPPTQPGDPMHTRQTSTLAAATIATLVLAAESVRYSDTPQN